jgi:hypothetical protein
MTVKNLIGVLTLLNDPRQMETLRGDRPLLAPAIEELLRYNSPVQLTGRLPISSMELCGKQIFPPIRRADDCAAPTCGHRAQNPALLISRLRIIGTVSISCGSCRYPRRTRRVIQEAHQWFQIPCGSREEKVLAYKLHPTQAQTRHRHLVLELGLCRAGTGAGCLP